MKHDTMSKTLTVAAILCIVCSVLVSTAAVKLKPMQEENKKLDIRKNLLLTAGLIENTEVSKQEINEKFKSVETVIVDLQTGSKVEGVDAETFDMKVAAKKKGQNYQIPAEMNVAKINFRSKLAKIYLIKDGGEIKSVVFPVSGKGLWSTLYGFLVLKPDMDTIQGLGFYDHGETPGLGGEVDNPNWKKLWVGKKAFKTGDDSFAPAIQVAKGPGRGDNQVDGLSGATLTSNGVSGLLKYWLGSDAYGPTLAQFRKKGSF